MLYVDSLKHLCLDKLSYSKLFEYPSIFCEELTYKRNNDRKIVNDQFLNDGSKYFAHEIFYVGNQPVVMIKGFHYRLLKYSISYSFESDNNLVHKLKKRWHVVYPNDDFIDRCIKEKLINYYGCVWGDGWEPRPEDREDWWYTITELLDHNNNIS